MDSDELITAVRLAARIPSTQADYTPARIRRELTDALQTIFVRPMKAAGAGYATQMAIRPIVSGQEFYRIPARAVVAGLVTLEVQDPGGTVHTMNALSQRDQAALTGQPGDPSGFVDTGDQIRLVPSPNVGGWFLRIWYKLRPSALVFPQTKGLITAINTTTRQITVNVVPTDQVLVAPITNATLIDVVSPDGSHELHLVGKSIASIIGTVITVTSGDDLSRIAVGDYVRAAEQSEWPMLPQEFHRTLSDAVAVVILSDMGAADKAAAIAGKVKSDIDRMSEMMEPRTRDLAKPFLPRYGVLRVARRFRAPPARL